MDEEASPELEVTADDEDEGVRLVAEDDEMMDAEDGADEDGALVTADVAKEVGGLDEGCSLIAPDVAAEDDSADVGSALVVVEAEDEDCVLLVRDSDVPSPVDDVTYPEVVVDDEYVAEDDSVLVLEIEVVLDERPCAVLLDEWSCDVVLDAYWLVEDVSTNEEPVTVDDPPLVLLDSGTMDVALDAVDAPDDDEEKALVGLEDVPLMRDVVFPKWLVDVVLEANSGSPVVGLPGLQKPSWSQWYPGPQSSSSNSLLHVTMSTQDWLNPLAASSTTILNRCIPVFMSPLRPRSAPVQPQHLHR